MLAKEEETEKKLVDLQRKDQGLADREAHLRQLQDELKQTKLAQQEELERIAGMTLQTPRRTCSSGARSSHGTTSRDGCACSRTKHAPSRSGGPATSSPMHCSASPRATPPRRPSR